MYLRGSDNSPVPGRRTRFKGKDADVFSRFARNGSIALESAVDNDVARESARFGIFDYMTVSFISPRSYRAWLRRRGLATSVNRLGPELMHSRHEDRPFYPPLTDRRAWRIERSIFVARVHKLWP